MFKLKILKYLEREDSAGVVSVLRKEGLGHWALTQLHQLVTAELTSERCARVQLVVKALEKLCKNNKDLQALLSCGLTSKLLWWYKSVHEQLSCDLQQDPALMDLTEAFFDYFLELAKPSVPVSELRVILLYLSRTALEVTVVFKLRLEAVQTFNSVVESSSREQRRVLQTHQDMKRILSEMAAGLFVAGDYELQACLTEALCRLTPRGDRPIRASEWFSPEVSHAFKTIRGPYFEADCRLFLNFLNSNQSDQRRVYTFPCLQAFLDSTQLFRPQDENLDDFWIDFNLGSECVSFFVDNPSMRETRFLWESIHVLRTEVSSYSLTEVRGVSLLAVDLVKPMMLEDFRGQRLELRFKEELHTELNRVICRVFKKPPVSASSMQTYCKRTPKKKPLRVLPLSSPSSEEDSVVKSSERSRAEILFDEVQHSTPVYKCGVRLGEEGLEGSSTSLEVVSCVRKRPFPDSGYLSDHATPIQWKRVRPTTEGVEDTAERAEPAAEEGVSIAERAELAADEEESMAERETVIYEVDPVKVKLEWSAEGVEQLAEKVDIQVTENTEPLDFERSELKSDITTTFRSQFEQQLTSHWQQVEGEVVKFQNETQRQVSELLSAFQERRAALGQMLGNMVWNWKAVEEFAAINASIMSFLDDENQRVTSFCQQQLLRLNSVEKAESGMGPK